MPTVLKQIPNVKLVIVGEGEQLSYLRQLTKSLSLEKSIVFTGAITQTEIPHAYAAADIFVLPSLFESFGISLVEAQASGKPVIATRVGGAPETLIDGQTGFLIDSRDSNKLSISILRLLSDNDLAHKMGINGLEFVQDKFGIQNIVEKIISSYENCSA